MNGKFVSVVTCLAFAAQTVNTSSVFGAETRKKSSKDSGGAGIFSVIPKKIRDKMKKYLSIFAASYLGYKALVIFDESFRKYQNREKFFSEKDFPKDIDPSVVELFTRRGSPFALQKNNKEGIVSLAKSLSDFKSKFDANKKVGIKVSPKDFCGNVGYDEKYLEALRKLPVNYVVNSGIFGKNNDISSVILQDAVSLETNRVNSEKLKETEKKGEMKEEDLERTWDTFLRGTSLSLKEGGIAAAEGLASAFSSWSRDSAWYVLPAMMINFAASMAKKHIQEEEQQQKNKGRRQ